MSSRGLLSFDMATRNAANLPDSPAGRTEFQLHGGSTSKNVVDFTERRLLRIAAKTHDAQLKLVLMAMIDDYRKGNIAVAWKRGQPIWFKVTKEL